MFNPSDFLKLAKTLGKSNESQIRTAVGRSYYASFLIIRNSLLLDDKTPEIHRKVLGILYGKNPVIANKLHYLRRLRNIADYDTAITMKKSEAENAIKLAEEIIIEIAAWKYPDQ